VLRSRGGQLSEDWTQIKQIDGYVIDPDETPIQMCCDNDVSNDIIEDIIGNLGASVLLANAAPDINYHNDVEVRDWAKGLSRFLLAGDHDYCSDEALHPLAECDGILVLAKNHKPKQLQGQLKMLTVLAADLFQHVSWAWWNATKIKIGSDCCYMWKWRDNEIQAFELRPNNKGVLHFRKRSDED
jgi:hypothetical protein